MHTHGTDGRVISDTENPHNFSHARIEQAASRMAPGDITAAVDAWTEIAAVVSAAADRFEAAVTRAVELGWEGAAADAAQPRVRELLIGLGALAAALAAQTGPLQAAADAAARFRAAIPPAVEAATGSDAARARNAAEEQARDDMANLYLRPYTAIAPTLPSFPPPVAGALAGPGPGASEGTGDPRQLLGAAVFSAESVDVPTDGDPAEGGAGLPEQGTTEAEVTDGATPAAGRDAPEPAVADGAGPAAGMPVGSQDAGQSGFADSSLFGYAMDRDPHIGGQVQHEPAPGVAIVQDASVHGDAMAPGADTSDADGENGDGRPFAGQGSAGQPSAGDSDGAVAENVPGDHSAGGSPGGVGAPGGSPTGGIGSSADGSSGLGAVDGLDAAYDGGPGVDRRADHLPGIMTEHESSALGAGQTTAAGAGPAANVHAAEPAGRQLVTPTSPPPGSAAPVSSVPASPLPSPTASPMTQWGSGTPQYNAPAVSAPAAPGIGASTPTPPVPASPTPAAPAVPSPAIPAVPSPAAPAVPPPAVPAMPPPVASAVPAPAAFPPAASALPSLAPAAPGAAAPTYAPTPPPAPSTGDRPNAAVATSSPDAPGPPGAEGPAPGPGSSVPRSSAQTPSAQTPSASTASPVAPIPRAAVTGLPGVAGVLAAAARLGAKPETEHRSPDYLRTAERGRELLGEREKTVPQALGADDPPPTARRAPIHPRVRHDERELLGEPEKTVPPAIGADGLPVGPDDPQAAARVPDPWSVRHGRELPGEPPKTVPPAIGADDRPAGPARSAVTDTTPGSMGHRYSPRYGQELLGEPPKTVPPAIGADDRPAGSGTEVTGATPRLPDQRPFVRRGAESPDATDHTGDCSLSLPPIDRSHVTGFRDERDGGGRTGDFPIPVPPGQAAPIGSRPAPSAENPHGVGRATPAADFGSGAAEGDENR